VDAFVLDRLERAGLAPAVEADRRTLLRRVTFDLTGLPPTPEEIASFLGDRRAGAYERVVDRLLGSKGFGERWGQHWLDVVRFAESNGYEHDDDRPQAWRYRDWVVDALNADMPFDRFVLLQVAGDLLGPDSFEMRTATGFLRTGPFHLTGGNLDPLEMRQEWLTEAVAGIGTGILGLSIGCARCHDHKFDPISQREYYQLQAFLHATANEDRTFVSDAEKAAWNAAVKAVKERIKPIEAEIGRIEAPYRASLREEKLRRLPAAAQEALSVPSEKRTAEQKRLASEYGAQLNVSWDEVVHALKPEDRSRRAGLRQRMFAIEREAPAPIAAAPGVGETAKPAGPPRLMVRGDVHTPGAEVAAGFPVCLSQGQAVGAKASRLQLAEWLSSAENPLTARVFVNRAWGWLFGRGLVSTPNDFGLHGAAPSHPALLDWLAAVFSARRSERDVHGLGWSVKGLVRLLVLSSVYRQGAVYDARKAARDPENSLLWRMNRKRLDAEEIRDSVLAVVGSLNRRAGGPSVRVPLEPEVYDTIFTEYEPDNLWPVTADPRQHVRRSLYLFRKRNVRLPMLALFDQPDLMSSCAARSQSVHALQALTLMNSEFMRRQSFLLAERLYRERGASVRARVERLFTLALGRPLSSAEQAATDGFLRKQRLVLGGRRDLAEPPHLPEGVSKVEFTVLADLCLAVLNLNDFVYVR
jgi:hypothetical protein